jgi:hypothetical protein
MPWKTLGVWSQIQSTADEETPAKPTVFQRFAYLVWDQEIAGSSASRQRPLAGWRRRSISTPSSCSAAPHA